MTARDSRVTRPGGALQWWALVLSAVALLVSFFSPQLQETLFESRGRIGGTEQREISGRDLDLEGSVGRLSKDHGLWIMVKPVDDLNHYAVEVPHDGRDWQVSAAVGEDRPTPGAEFWVYLYDVTRWQT